MIDTDKLRKDLDMVFSSNSEEDVLNYIVALIREDVIKLMRDVHLLANDDKVCHALYKLSVETLVDEMNATILDIVNIFNSLSGYIKLTNIEVNIDPKAPEKGPTVIPTIKD